MTTVDWSDIDFKTKTALVYVKRGTRTEDLINAFKGTKFSATLK